jgi:hypothetical protein
MRFSILHISDLHRDLRNEVANEPLLDSLAREFERYGQEQPAIIRPSLCIISGDLVFGVRPGAGDSETELRRQYDQAEEFLIMLADRFFNGGRHRLVILPGNHDVSYPAVLASAERIEIPADPVQRKLLVEELFTPRSKLRWSWSEMCFFRITDDDIYERRLAEFTRVFERFYQTERAFRLVPEEQYEVFDFPECQLSVVALNSCFRNDPLRRAGSFNPTALSAACRHMADPKRAGWLLAATWHHSIFGGPLQDDYLDPDFLQLLIDSGISLGFHGHQHSHDCIDERYRLGPAQRKITVISAGTLCAEPRELRPGISRGYNLVEIDTDKWIGRVHSRAMINATFDLPLWGPGHFIASGKPYVDFELCPPVSGRPAGLDEELTLAHADELLGRHEWQKAAEVLSVISGNEKARPLIVKAVQELGDPSVIIRTLWPPLTDAEAVLVGGAIIEARDDGGADAFCELPLVISTKDASVKDIEKRIRLRRVR